MSKKLIRPQNIRAALIHTGTIKEKFSPKQTARNYLLKDDNNKDIKITYWNHTFSFVLSVDNHPINDKNPTVKQFKNLKIENLSQHSNRVILNQHQSLLMLVCR